MAIRAALVAVGVACACSDTTLGGGVSGRPAPQRAQASGQIVAALRNVNPETSAVLVRLRALGTMHVTCTKTSRARTWFEAGAVQTVWVTVPVDGGRTWSARRDPGTSFRLPVADRNAQVQTWTLHAYAPVPTALATLFVSFGRPVASVGCGVTMHGLVSPVDSE